MGKVFEIDFRNGTAIENISTSYPTGTGIDFYNSSKGYVGKSNQTGNYTYANPENLNFGTSEFSYLIVLKAFPFNNIGSTVNAFIGNGDVLGGATLGIETRSTNILRFVIGNGTSVQSITDNDYIDINFHLYYFERNSSNQINLYKDNILISTDTSSYNVSTSNDFNIFSDSLTQRYSKAEILYIKFFDKVLNEDERDKEYSLYNSSFPVKKVNRPFYGDKKISDLSNELGLILAYNMKPVNGIMTDLSGNGWDGNVYGVTQTKEGVSTYNSTSVDRIENLNDNNYTTWSLCIRFKSFNGGTLAGFSATSSIWERPQGIAFRSSSATFYYFTTDIFIRNEFANYIFVSDGVNISYYLNGNYINSITPDDTIIKFLRFITVDTTNQRTFSGIYEDVRCYNRVLTNKEIRAYNDLFEKKITLKDNFDDNIINGNILGWKVGSGIFKAGEASITETWIPSAVENGGGSGTGDWLNPISGVAEHWTVAIPGSTPQTGLRTWSVTTSSGFIGNVQRCQSNDILPTTLCSEPFVLDIGNSYRIRFKYKSTYSGIISTMYYYNGSSYVPVSGMPDLSERTFTTTTTATEVSWNFMLVDEPGPYVIYWNYAGTYCSAGEYMEFDEVYIDKLEYIETLFPPEIDTSGYINQYKFIECTSDGSISTQSNLAYGTWEFDVYKDDANECSVSIVNVLNTIGTGRYVLTIYNNDSIALLRDSTVLFQTVDSYISDMIWYRLKITRDLNGKFHVYIKGGDFGERYIIVDTTGGSGVNPVTDTNYTISKYIVLDMDTGDRFRALKNMGLVTDTPNNELSAVLNLTF